MNEIAHHEMPEVPEAPPRGVRAMAAVRWVILLALSALAITMVWRYWGPGTHAAHRQDRYYCPMHPQVRSPDPGECPICHMNLEPIPADRRTPTGPMGAAIVNEQDARLQTEQSADRADRAQSTHVHGNESAVNREDGNGNRNAEGISGLVPITLSAERLQLIGVTTEPAVRERVGETLRAPAVVETREDAIAHVRIRAPGFVERVAVSETAVHVARGQTLAWIYSPEVYQAQQELLTAHRWALSGSSPDAGTARTETGHASAAQANDIERAARARLELLGLAPSDIDDVLRTGQPLRAFPVRAPRAGYVLRREAVLGLYATPETLLYEIADLSTVWIIANLYERDLVRVRRGTIARFETPSLPGQPLVARIELVEPRVDPDTRTARVRLEVANPMLRLRPGVFGDVVFELDPREALLVPRDAVVDTGEQQYLFVERGGGLFEPRRVRLGGLHGSRIEVLSGIANGERVVVRGAFMLDSESRLQATLQGSDADTRP